MRKLLYIILSILTCSISIQAENQFRGLTSGDYALSQSIQTINKKTKKPETLVIIETLKVDVKRSKDIVITPMDTKSKYFDNARGFITDDGRVQFGFTLVKKRIIFSVNYDGKLTEDGYVKGKVIGIYPGSEAAVKGDWAMKPITKPEKPTSLKYR